MALTFRGIKGTALTINELDNNFRHFTGSHHVSGTINISGSIIPYGSGTYDLGSSTNPWKDLYLSSASLKLLDGAGGEQTLTYTKLSNINNNQPLKSGSWNTPSGSTNTGSFTNSGSFNNSGSANFSGSWDSQGLSRITGSMKITGSYQGTGSFNHSGPFTLGSGSFTISGSVLRSGSLYHSGSANFSGSWDSQGLSRITGSMKITGSYQGTGSFAHTGSLTLAGPLNVTEGGISGSFTGSYSGSFIGYRWFESSFQGISGGDPSTWSFYPFTGATYVSGSPIPYSCSVGQILLYIHSNDTATSHSIHLYKNNVVTTFSGSITSNQTGSINITGSSINFGIGDRISVGLHQNTSSRDSEMNIGSTIVFQSI